ncbi:unnamed protein product [Arctogadus glacialis]
MAFVLTFAVLLSVTGCAELITVTSPQRYVNVTVGGSLLLQCSFVSTTLETTNLVVMWNFVEKSSSSLKQIYYSQADQDVVPPEYKGRLSLPPSHGTGGNVSIGLRNMQTADSGLYTCEVRNSPDIGGKTEASIIVRVLEPPSAPFCAVHGDVAVGHLVTLTCHSEKGSPPPTYTWVRLDQARARQPIMARVTPTGILEIRNISEFKFGEYQCTSTNAVGTSTCMVELSQEAEDGVIAGAVIGALLGCLLIVLVVWFIAHQVKKHRYTAVKTPAAEMKGSSRPPPATSAVSMEMSSPSHDSTHGDDDEARA